MELREGGFAMDLRRKNLVWRKAAKALSGRDSICGVIRTFHRSVNDAVCINFPGDSGNHCSLSGVTWADGQIINPSIF